MDHVAIMDKKLGLIEGIVDGRKRIESRWYANRIAPWGKIKKDDVVYFKYSGKPISAKAIVEKVIEIEGLDESIFQDIVKKYGDLIMLNDREYSEYYHRKRYVILIFLMDAEYISKPFDINKDGYGSGCAWMCVEKIELLLK
jgi:hypothetical protein